ncbi:alpha/beta fold hydrolase [Streptomyces longwoodensis]|uniref:alpha/beta fold hydrolase n=1 Tax=Streptomyces longwoodensis TaxID=68231 RepID=UPI00352C3228
MDQVLEEIIAVEGAQRGLDLFGWSFGGLVALEAAARRPAAVLLTHPLRACRTALRPSRTPRPVGGRQGR